MPSNDEKQCRKQLLNQLRSNAKQEFDDSLPMSREDFQKLFDYLDAELDACDDTLNLTERFLSENAVLKKDDVVLWLREHGGYCDCEVLANVEEKFE